MYSTNLSLPHSNSSQRVNWRVDDFCRAHGIGRTLFYDEVKRGEIKTIRVGSRTLVPDAEARAWQVRKETSSQVDGD
jgi:hypothetical protein